MPRNTPRHTVGHVLMEVSLLHSLVFSPAATLLLLALAGPVADPPRRAAVTPDPALTTPLVMARAPEVDLGEVSALEGTSLKARALSLIVRSPGRWRLTMRADDDFRGPAARTVPAERMRLSLPGGPHVPLSRVQAMTLATGDPTGALGLPVEADLRLELPWEAAPGIYEGRVALSLEQDGALPSGSPAFVRVHFVVRPVLSISVDPDVIDLGSVPVESNRTFRAPVPLAIRIRSNGGWILAAGVSDLVAHAESAGRAALAAASPSVRLENLSATTKQAITLAQTRGTPSPLLSGGSTGSDGLTLRPQVVVDVPPGTAPGTYRLRVLVELKGAP